MHVITALSQGGAVRLLAELIARTAGGVRHSVLNLTGGEPFFDLGDTPIIELGLSRGQFSPLAPLQAAAAVRRAVPDLLHAWLYHGNLLAALTPRRRGLPLLWSIHNTTLPPNGAKSMTRQVNRACAWLSHRVPSRIVYCAEPARRLHEDAFGYDRARGAVIENGVDFEAFAFDPARRSELRSRWGLDPQTIAVGCAGRFDPQKDYGTVLAAMRRLDDPRTRLVLAGEGCDASNPEMADLLAGSGFADRTLALGALGDMPGFLSALDMLVIGSAFGEALPMIGLEAAANGLPIVATEIGSVEELVLSPAHLVPPRDPVALAGAIAAALPIATARCAGQLIESPRRARLREVHGIERTVSCYRRLYEDITGVDCRAARAPALVPPNAAG